MERRRIDGSTVNYSCSVHAALRQLRTNAQVTSFKQEMARLPWQNSFTKPTLANPFPAASKSTTSPRRSELWTTFKNVHSFAWAAKATLTIPVTSRGSAKKRHSLHSSAFPIAEIRTAKGVAGVNVNQNRARAGESNGNWTTLFPRVYFIVSVDKSDYPCARSSTRNNSHGGWKRKKLGAKGMGKKTLNDGGRREGREEIGENEVKRHARELTRNARFPRSVSRRIKQTDILEHT